MLKDIKSQLDLNANVSIEITDTKTGEVIQKIRRRNLVVTAGRNLVRDLINETTDTGVTHLAVGTGTTAVAAGDTTLGSEQVREVLTKRTASSGSVLWSYYLSSTQGNGNDLTEAGLFNASSGGTLFARVVHTAITKTSSIAVTYNWTINIGAS